MSFITYWGKLGRILGMVLKIPEWATSELTEQVMRVLIYCRLGQILRRVLKKFHQISHIKTCEWVSQLQEGAWRQDQHRSVLQTKNFSLDAGTLKSQNSYIKLSRAPIVDSSTKPRKSAISFYLYFFILPQVIYTQVSFFYLAGILRSNTDKFFQSCKKQSARGSLVMSHDQRLQLDSS